MNCIPFSRSACVLLATLAVAAPTLLGGSRAQPLDPSQVARLRALNAPALESLRAGAPPQRADLSSAERDVLRRVEMRTPALETMRAGLDDNTLLLIIAVAAVIVVLILVL